MAFDLHGGRDAVELFGHIFANALQTGSAGADLLIFGQIRDDHNAWQMIGQRFAATFKLGVGRDIQSEATTEHQANGRSQRGQSEQERNRRQNNWTLIGCQT